MIITVKAARVNKGLSQQEVANQMGLSLRAYQRKENGEVRIYADEIVALGRLFGIPVQNFFESQCRKKTRNTA
ncbi:helix-turn-helix domain-containing protein [Paenibacillus cineris]|uniref:helix-turn-helix domain-containing protein n=1 Tax=Paenibacillus cineris TaxID=237530 RepID=UPI001B09F755|nr:helix-turn-helix transcriptional regulator [Paenibacillus cineris]GIO63534.1 hypothetical protein J43TS9_51080 [Paenibacillus cineris]